jgi:Phosphotransferase enzyme family
VPEPLGIDSKGREVLRHIAGRDQGWPLHADILSPTGAEALGRFATCLKDALGDYECPSDAEWQFGSGKPLPGQCVQHGDLGPWNLLWDNGPDVVGILDWDFAGPQDPTYDLGHLAWFTVPLMDDERAWSRGFPTVPDRWTRIHAFAEGAGLTPSLVLTAGVRAQHTYERIVIERARSGSGQWAAFYEHGFHENAAADRRWTVDHLIRA